jgi:hypothetical protein
MASEEQDLAEAALAPGGRRQRPPATIDLTATDISGAPAAVAPVEEEPAKVSEAELSIAPDAVTPPPGTPPPSGPGPDQPAGNASAPSGSAPAPRARRGRSVFAFTLAGATVAILAAALPWGLGVLAPRDGGSDELAAKVAGLELQLRDAASRPPAAAADKSDLDAAISRRLDAVEARLGRQDGGASASPDPALADRLAASEMAVRALNGSIADLRARIDALAEKVASQPAVAGDQGAIDALNARMVAIESAARTLDTRLTASATSTDAPARTALVALELRVAVERGAPFATELAAAKPLIQDEALFQALDAVAATGVRTPQALARELANISPAMLRTAGQPTQDRGLLERLQANMERLVRIRPIEETPGDDPSTIIVRAEIKATHGDIRGALAEISALPDAVKAPAAQWIKSAQLRVDAVEAVHKFSVGALAALGKPVP